MLSILIPIYNFSVEKLIKELLLQSRSLDIPFEILCYDDKSDDYFLKKNKNIENIKEVCYTILNNNLGRSKIRNLLAEQAKFNNLLFLDCDIKISNKKFIKNYLELEKKHKVIVGGVSYDDFNSENSKFLRWKYGKSREQKTAKVRQEFPYHSFSSCNLFIRKEIIQRICFSEKLLQYGHEDTLFGLELQQLSIPILHIDNPIIHVGLDDTAVFLNKTELGLMNLTQISKSSAKICSKIKICSYYNFFKYSLFITKPIFMLLRKILKKTIINGSNSLILFDLYKLSFMLTLKKE